MIRAGARTNDSPPSPPDRSVRMIQRITPWGVLAAALFALTVPDPAASQPRPASKRDSLYALRQAHIAVRVHQYQYSERYNVLDQEFEGTVPAPVRCERSCIPSALARRTDGCAMGT